MYNESLWNEGLWNGTGGATLVIPPPGEIVDTPDPGVSFVISDELGGETQESNDECRC